MKKVIVAALVAMLTTTLFAREMKVLPILTDGDYCLGPGVALIGGYIKHEEGDASAVYGVEFSLACPAFQLPSLDIKQQISLVRETDGDFEAITLEFNPHVMFDVSKNFQLGVGPSLGVVFAKEVESDVAYAVGAGVSANYNFTNGMFVGAEARYQWTSDVELVAGANFDLNNARAVLKVGMHF